MAEQDALTGAKLSDSLFIGEFPVKLRVLTIDPLVYTDSKFANTKYAFVVFNLDEDRVQILEKGPGFIRRFQDIHTDPDFGSDIRKMDVKVTTNGKAGIEIRYTITPVGEPKDLTQKQLKIIKDAKIDLDTIIKKNNPNAIRLSEVNAGKDIPEATEPEEIEPGHTQEDPVIEDVGDDIDLADIPF